MTRSKASRKIIIISVLITAALAISCGKNVQESEAQPEITELKAHRWYSFSTEGLHEIDLPQNAPDTAIKPWTEAIRISGAGSHGNLSCALVNRLGIVDFSGGQPQLHRDVQLFTGVTADSLLFTQDGPVFHIYRNKHFNSEPERNKNTERTLLARYDTERKVCVPVLSYNDFGIPDESEITSILPKDGSWLAVIKTATPDRTNFKYMKFAAPEEDGSIPNPEGAAITAAEIDADTFRRAQMPLPFQSAPDSLKALFAAIPTSFEFYLSCRTDGKAAAVLYDNTQAQSPAGGYISQGYAQIFPERGAAAVFSDGTTYMSSSLLNDKADAKDVTVFRLPKLPAGFVYGEMVLSGNTLFVGWEESDFYKTGRSGFISVALEKIASMIGAN